MSEGDAEKTPAEMRNRLAAERVIQALNSRHMEGYFVNASSFENSSDFVWVTQYDLQQKYALPSAFSKYIKKGWDMV